MNQPPTRIATRTHPSSARALMALAASSCLAACAHAPGVDANLNQTALTRSKTAVGIMQMGIEGEGCAVTTIEIAKRNGPAFEVVETLKFLPVPGSAGDAAQFELPPGEYHIVSWKCDRSVGRKVNIITLGKHEGGNILGTGGRYTESYGAFSLTVGEIVNLGYVRLVRTGTDQVRLDVGDLQPRSREKLEKEKPQLAAGMKARFVKVSTTPMIMRRSER